MISHFNLNTNTHLGEQFDDTERWWCKVWRGRCRCCQVSISTYQIRWFCIFSNNFHDSFEWILIFSPADSSLLQKIIRKGLLDTKSELDIIRQDPNSPLYSAKTFEELKLYVYISLIHSIVFVCICENSKHCLCWPFILHIILKSSKHFESASIQYTGKFLRHFRRISPPVFLRILHFPALLLY